MFAKAKRITKKISILSVLLFITGCTSSNGDGNIDEVKSAPKSLTLAGNTYTLEADIWRDLMPTIDTSLNKGIVASLNLIASGNFPADDSMKAVKIFILNKDSVWETKPQRQSVMSANVMEVYASGGPLWKPGTMVTAVLELKYGNQTKFLSSGEIEVHAVY